MQSIYRERLLNNATLFPIFKEIHYNTRKKNPSTSDDNKTRTPGKSKKITVGIG